MNSIDKNDVDISNLFNWGTEFSINMPDGEATTFYIRVIGDAEINRARTFALRKSAEYRKKLKTDGTDERLAFVPDVDSVDKEVLIELIMSLMIKDIGSRVRKEIEIPYPKEPRSDSDLEEFESYQEEVDTYPDLIEKTVDKALREGVDKERSKLKKMSLEKLISLYEKELINRLCETEMYNKFQDMCVYFAVYKDLEYTERMFANFEQFDNLPTRLKEKLITKYSTLDINIEDLKK